MFPFHLVDHLGKLRGRRRNAGFWFKEVDNLKSKALFEVGPFVVIGNDLCALERERLQSPFPDFFIKPIVEFLQVLLIVGLVLGINADKAFVDILCDGFPVRGVEPVMRIAIDVDISLCAADAGWYLKQRNIDRGIDVPGRSFQDVPVARTVQQRWHPSGLQIQADGDEQIRP